VILVITAAVVVRLALLDRQSYWTDELFSVNESAGSVATLRRVAAAEVHPPLYAALLWGWIRIGGTGEAETRLLSTLCAVAAIAVTYRGLRAVPLDRHVRWALTAVTAANGTALVHSLETRSYALLLLACTGVTAATLRVAVGGDRSRRAYLTWIGWGLLAGTVHLFGAFLAAAAAAVLALGIGAPVGADRVRTAARWVLAGGAAAGLQAAWLAAGLTRPRFASGTEWIRPPTGADVWDLVTTTFAAGGIAPHKDGFAWTSPVGVAVVGAGCVVAVVAGRHARPEPAAESVTAEGRAAAVLLGVAVLVTAVSFVLSQWQHVWTLRNLTVVGPAALWGVVCAAAAATRTARGRRVVASSTLVLLGVALVPLTVGLVRPYKPDARALMHHLIAVRHREPDAVFSFLSADSPDSLLVAADLPRDDQALRTVYRHVTAEPATARTTVARVTGPQVVIFYHGVDDPTPRQAVADLVERLGPGRCRAVPIYGYGVVDCTEKARSG
jgi:hypothetical protein